MFWRKLITSNNILARSSHGVSVVNINGKNTLVVFGGENLARTPINSKVHMLDISKNNTNMTWKEGELSSNNREVDIPEPRIAHTQVSVGSKIYIFGGRQSVTMEEAPLNDFYSFCLNTFTWENLSKPKSGETPSPRSFHKMLSIGNTLYVFGGCGAKGRMSDLYSYDIEERSWTKLPTCETRIPGRGGAGFVNSSDSKSIFIVGGFAGKEMNDVFRYDIETQKYYEVCSQDDTNINNKLRPFSVSCGGVLNGNIYYFGGEVDPSQIGHEGAGGFSNDVQVLNGKTGNVIVDGGKLKSDDAMKPMERGWTDAATFIEDDVEKLVVFGGLSGDDDNPTRLNDLWVLEGAMK